MLNISNMGTLYVKHWQKISSILEGALSSRMSPWQRAKGSEKRNTRHFASLLLLYLEDTHRVHKKKFCLCFMKFQTKCSGLVIVG